MSNYASIDVLVRFIVLYVLYDKDRKQKEETLMLTSNTKKVNFWSEPYVPLPNAATRRQVLQKIVDTALIIASCAGIVAIMLFFTVAAL